MLRVRVGDKKAVLGVRDITRDIRRCRGVLEHLCQRCTPFLPEIRRVYHETAETVHVASSLAQKTLSNNVLNDLKPILEKTT